jgi:hypothetical protein
VRGDPEFASSDKVHHLAECVAHLLLASVWLIVAPTSVGELSRPASPSYGRPP